MWSEWRWRSHLPRLTLAVPLKHTSFSVHSSNTKRRGQESPTSYLFHPKLPGNSPSSAHSDTPLQPGHQRRQRRPARAPRPTPPSPQCFPLNTDHPNRSPDHPHRHPFLPPKEGLPPVEGFLLVGLSEGAPRCPWHEGACRRRPGRRVCALVAARSGATAGLRRGGRRERSPAASPASFPSAVARARVVQLRGSAAKT